MNSVSAGDNPHSLINPSQRTGWAEKESPPQQAQISIRLIFSELDIGKPYCDGIGQNLRKLFDLILVYWMPGLMMRP